LRIRILAEVALRLRLSPPRSASSSEVATAATASTAVATVVAAVAAGAEVAADAAVAAAAAVRQVTARRDGMRVRVAEELSVAALGRVQSRRWRRS
jgi:hypothetical protein